MSLSDKFQKMNPKEFMEALRQEVKTAIYRFGRYSTQERTASSLDRRLQRIKELGHASNE